MNKELLQKQIEEMKVKLANMETELAKPEKFEFKYERDKTYLMDSYSVLRGHSGLDSRSIEYGRYRKTEGAAQLARKLNKRVNRLHALAEQLGGLREFKSGENNCVIYYTNYDGWEYNMFYTTFEPEKVYMTKECAIEICRMLNNGEVEL